MDVAKAAGTPVYAYSRDAVLRRYQALRAALPVGSRICYALKANRFPPLVRLLREAGAHADACSPREVDFALDMDFSADQISVTASMLSDRDLDRFVARGVHLNLDARSALRRYGARVPAGTRVGLRLDPGVDVGYGRDPKVTYGNTKFGFRVDDLADALAAANSAGLAVDTLHMHAGWGLQEADTEGLSVAFSRLAQSARRVPGLTAVNVGGGLGARQQEADRPLPLEVWAALVHEHLAPLGLTVTCEPGTFLVAHAGILVTEVTQVERKGDVTWVGVDAGHNVNVYAAHYGIPMEILGVADPLAAPVGRVHVAGNLNEAGDVFARDRALPAVREGDLVAFFPAGAYGATMASDHCLRGWAGEVMV